MPSVSGKPTTAAAQQQGHEQPPATTLQTLPDFLLLWILDRLNLAADLAAAAATCSALKSLVEHTQWKHICSYNARCGWSPALPGSLQWAANHCPQLRDLDLSGATACCDADLLPLCQLSSLTRLSLEGLWRVTVSAPNGPTCGQRGHMGPYGWREAPALNRIEAGAMQGPGWTACAHLASPHSALVDIPTCSL